MTSSLIGVALAVVLPFALPSGIRAQEPVRRTEQGILVDFQDADLRVVITALAEAGGLNVTYGDLPARRVTLRMQQPLKPDQVMPLLRSIAQSNGLELVEDGPILRLQAADAPSARAEERGPDSQGPEPRIFVLRLKHARAGRLAGTLQAILGGSRASTAPEARARAPLSEQLRERRIPPADTTPRTPDVRVEVGPVVVPSVTARLEGEVQIVPDEATNALVIRATPSDYEVVRSAVQALDLRPLQVLIEVLIAEVRHTRDLDISISGRGSNRQTTPGISGELKGSTGGDLLIRMTKLGGLDLDATLSALASRGSVRILSRPVVFAQNNQEARILIGSERPFIQVFRSLPTDDAVRDQVVQYRDVGTSLSIVPTINDDGYVNLQVTQEVSTATAETQFGAPVISTREASTHLFVRDGQTAVLGGLVDRQEDRSRTGIPVLMEIPIIGGLFGSTRTSHTNSELFLFLTPHVVSDDGDTDRLREEVRERGELLGPELPSPLPLLRPDTSRAAPPPR